MSEGYHKHGDSAWDDENEEEEEDQKQRPESYKEKLIFLIDAQDSMFEEIKLCGEPTTSFEAAQRTVVELLKLKAIQHPDDQVAVFLYNTREKDQPGGGSDTGAGAGGSGSDGAGGSVPFVAAFEGVRTLLELQQPSAEAVRAVRDLTADVFRTTIGGLPSRRDAALADALFRVQNCLAASRTADRSINTLVVFTNDSEPCGSSGGPGYKAALAQLSGRVEALQGYRVGLRLFPLAAAVRPFDSGRLWRSVLKALPGRSEEGEGGEGGEAAGGGGGSEGGTAGGEWVGYDEALLRELASDPAQRPDPVTALTALFDSFKRRLSRKRTMMRLSWQLSGGLQVAVKGYLLISDEVKNAKRTVPLNPVTNQPLKIVTSLVSTSDGRLLEREEVSRMKLFRLKTGNTSRMPEVTVAASEVAATGAGGLVPPGLVLLGFKPLACLRTHHQMRPSVFLRPDERSREGSTVAFIAVWRAMLAEGKYALCRYRRANSPPQLVALVPQDEGIDSYGVQTDPPGIHMIYLPYMDDVRYPETATGVAPQQPSDEQLSAARALVASLDLERVEPFDLTQIPNPWLQRHYQVVEALALSEPIPEWSALGDDGTRPQKELFQSGQAPQAIEAFRQAFPQGGGGGGRGTKRKAEGDAAPAAALKAAKAEAVADIYATIDWEAYYRENRLDKLTKEDLSTYLRRHKLKLSGNKGDLVQRVREHMDAQRG